MNSKEDLEKSKTELEELLNSILENGEGIDREDIIGVIDEILKTLDNINAQLEDGNFKQSHQFANQEPKIDHKDLYLYDDEIKKIYEQNGGKEETVVCHNIEGEVGLEGMFYHFLGNKTKNQRSAL
jgi:hypothetical protein